jgi:uncharacterized protein YjdB
MAAPVTWESSNPAVATVSEAGKVTAKKAGKATITARCADLSTTVAVSVVGPPSKTAKKPNVHVTVPHMPKTIGNGTSVHIQATYTPAAALSVHITYKSSDPSVVSVTQGGWLHAKKPGQATITVAGGGATKTYQITSQSFF